MSEASRSRVPVKVEAAGDTHIGGRSHNEDAILLRPDLNLYLVADGAGGQNAGNVAASLAITTVAHFFERTRTVAEKLPQFDALGLPTAARRLSTAVQEANQEILAISKHSDRHKGMGSTLVAALFDPRYRRMHIAHVGDSRCYRLRNGMLEQLTHDHSLVNDVLELRPNIADERLRKLPSNVITRALGMMDNLRIAIRSHDVAPGDRYLLCSDGVTDVLTREQIAEALAIDSGCDELVSLLINMSLENKSEDNIAAVVIDCALPAGLDSKASAKPLRTGKHASRPGIPALIARRKKAKKEEDEVPPARDTDRGVAPPSEKNPLDAPLDGDPDEDIGDRVSTPEIMLYEPGGDDDGRDSIHLVPADSAATPDVLQAVQHVMAADEEPGRLTRAYSPKGAITAPRVAKTHRDDPDDARTGETESPPYSGHPGVPGPGRPAIKPPDTHNFEESGLKSDPGTYPDRAAAVPPMRDPLDTTDYSHDEMRPCHACGSIIASDAERCMYCGAETGFFPKR